MEKSLSWSGFSEVPLLRALARPARSALRLTMPPPHSPHFMSPDNKWRGRRRSQKASFLPPNFLDSSLAYVRRYYGLLDVFVYPRHRMRLTDLVTPLKPLEAMAQGKLVFASDVGGHQELIKHGKTGYLFPADDKAGLVRALEDLFSQRSSASLYDRLYKQLIRT